MSLTKLLLVGAVQSPEALDSHDRAAALPLIQEWLGQWYLINHQHRLKLELEMVYVIQENENSEEKG